MNEANIQAEFYHQCRLIGLPVELELTTPVGRLDVAIISANGTSLVAIVECKRNRLYANPDSFQSYRYRKIGVPLYFLTDFNKAGQLALEIANKHGADQGVAIIAIKQLPRLKSHNRLDTRPLVVDHNGKLHIPV